jgi:AraC family transcriptional regulator
VTRIGADAGAVAPAGTSTSSDPWRRNSSAGHIYFWQAASLWIGQGLGRTDWHEHHAHQLALALEGDFRFRTRADGRWETFEAAIVPSHCAHQFEVDGTRLAHLFVEPESRAGRALAGRFRGDRISPLPPGDAADAAGWLRSALDARLDAARMVETACEALARLSGTNTEPSRELDARLARALEYIRCHIRDPISLADAAAVATLSESRFRHLFVAETGCSFRAYLLWQRINVAIAAVMAGASWTEAAHEAGFADSAHLTRTHKRMFGIEPTAVRPQ